MSDEGTGEFHRTEEPDPARFRTTIYLTEVELALLDDARTRLRRSEYRRVDRSELIRRAIHTVYGNSVSNGAGGGRQ